MPGTGHFVGGGKYESVVVVRNIKQLTTTDPYRRSGTKQIFQTDPPKTLIGSVSRVVEHPHKACLRARFFYWACITTLNQGNPGERRPHFER